MTLHRFIPVPLALDEPERLPLWRCEGCGANRQDPTPRLTDDCAALTMIEDGAA